MKTQVKAINTTCDNLFDNLVVMHHNISCLEIVSNYTSYLIGKDIGLIFVGISRDCTVYTVQSKFLLVESTRLKLPQVNSSHVIYVVTS